MEEKNVHRNIMVIIHMMLIIMLVHNEFAESDCTLCGGDNSG